MLPGSGRILMELPYNRWLLPNTVVEGQKKKSTL